MVTLNEGETPEFEVWHENHVGRRESALAALAGVGFGLPIAEPAFWFLTLPAAVVGLIGEYRVLTNGLSAYDELIRVYRKSGYDWVRVAELVLSGEIPGQVIDENTPAWQRLLRSL